MRTALSWVVLVACSYTPPGPTGDGGVIDDSGREVVTWSFDTAADFQRVGAVLDAVGIEPHGSLTSGAYLVGAVTVRATSSQLWSSDQADNELDLTPTLTAPVLATGFTRTIDLDNLPASALAPFGITNGEFFSLWFEGEMLLDTPGIHTIHLDGDDVVFLELAPPGTTAFSQVGVSRFTAATDVSYTVDTPGWHPFRIGLGQGTGVVRSRITLADPGQSLEVLDRDRLRTRVDGMRGLVRQLFDRSLYAGVRDSTGLDPMAAGAFTFPPDAPTVGSWSARWAGQFYATTAGSYRFAVSSDDGHELVAETATASAGFTVEDSGTFASTATADLAVGWNQLVIGLHQRGGPGALALVVEDGPEAALVGQPLPPERLRPAETRQLRTLSASRTNSGAINNNSTQNKATRPMDFTGTTGEVSHLIDFVIDATTDRWEDINIELQAPGAPTATVLLSAGQATPGAGRRFHRIRITEQSHPDLIGVLVDGTWTPRIFDTDSNGNNGTLHAAFLAIHTRDGSPTIAEQGTWTSEIIDLADRPLVDVISVAWTARTPTGADAELTLRACETPTCEGEPWSEPITNGGAPELPPDRRYLQARVRLSSDGLREAELEQLTITYRRPPPS